MCLDTRPTRRGAQVFVHELSNELLNRGVKVTKVYLYDAPVEGRLQLNDQDLVLNGNDRHIFEKFPTIHPLLLRKLHAAIKMLQPDIVLLNGSRTLKYAAAVKPLLNEPPIFLYRVIDSVKFWNNSAVKQVYYRRFIMPALDAAVGVSQTSLNEMVTFHNFKKPVRAIPRAIDSRKFESLPAREICRKDLGVGNEDFVVLFLGNITRQKRPDRFLQIIDALRREIPNIKGWIVGDGPLRQEVEEEINARGLRQHVVLWGYQQSVGMYIRASQLLILCSDTEGLPGVVLEAAAAGVPAIAGNVGGVRECIDNDITGVIVQPDDVQAFVRETLQLWLQPDKAAAMGKAASEKVKASFSIQQVTDDYLHYFNSLLRQNDQPQRQAQN
jgi:glycosyltransferase involved in cell wall biosynthesis